MESRAALVARSLPPSLDANRFSHKLQSYHQRVQAQIVPPATTVRPFILDRPARRPSSFEMKNVCLPNTRHLRSSRIVSSSFLSRTFSSIVPANSTPCAFAVLANASTAAQGEACDSLHWGCSSSM